MVVVSPGDPSGVGSGDPPAGGSGPGGALGGGRKEDDTARDVIGHRVHGFDLDVGSDRTIASNSSVSRPWPSGNDRVTGRNSVKARPPPGRRAARSEPPRRAACSAAMARPRPEVEAAAARDGSAL